MKIYIELSPSPSLYPPRRTEASRLCTPPLFGEAKGGDEHPVSAFSTATPLKEGNYLSAGLQPALLKKEKDGEYTGNSTEIMEFM